MTLNFFRKSNPQVDNTGDSIVRWALRTDLRAIVEIERDSNSPPLTHDEFIALFRQRSVVCVVAERDGKILGFTVYRLWESQIEILRMGVSPDARRQKVGRDLLLRLKLKINGTLRRRIVTLIPETNLDAQLFLQACCFGAERCIAGAFPPADGILFRYPFNPKPQEEHDRAGPPSHPDAY